MTARPFAGLRVTLVAAFNPRYHRSGLALAGALADLGCEVRRCEERLRGWNAVWRRPLVARLDAALARAPADVVLVFKATKLAPGAVTELNQRRGGRGVNWVPAGPHQPPLCPAPGPPSHCFLT